MVQNSEACVVRHKMFDHITPVLCNLHWLPICQRIQFELAMIVFKCLHSLAPSYLADDCILASTVAGRRYLRSTDTMKLSVQRTSTVVSARACAVSAAVIWNSLPAELRLTSSIQTSARKLNFTSSILHQLDNVTAAHLRTKLSTQIYGLMNYAAHTLN